MDFLVQPTLGPNTQAVADDEHADHEFRIDRRPAGVAVERRQMLAQFAQIQEAINASNQVIARDVIVQVECVEQVVLNDALTHHDALPPSMTTSMQRASELLGSGKFFNTIDPKPTFVSPHMRIEECLPRRAHPRFGAPTRERGTRSRSFRHEAIDGSASEVTIPHDDLERIQIGRTRRDGCCNDYGSRTGPDGPASSIRQRTDVGGVHPQMHARRQTKRLDCDIGTRRWGWLGGHRGCESIAKLDAQFEGLGLDASAFGTPS